jgi:hypothetical protein
MSLYQEARELLTSVQKDLETRELNAFRENVKVSIMKRAASGYGECDFFFESSLAAVKAEKFLRDEGFNEVTLVPIMPVLLGAKSTYKVTVSFK